MVDGREGVTPADEEVAALLRRAKKRVILVVNKLDRFEVENTYDFYSLGFGEPFPISCQQGKGLGEVLDEIISAPCFKEASNFEESSTIKIAVVGRPNAGKSSIVNRLLGEERVVVSNVAGTTRDAIDTPFRYNGKDFVLIDTAGLRRQRSVEKESVEGYSALRAREAIGRADVV